MSLGKCKHGFHYISSRSQEFSIIFVVVDRLSKYCHLGALESPFITTRVVALFLQMVVKLHGFPCLIVLDRDLVSTSKFCKELFALSETTLNMIGAYHLDLNG